MTDKDYNRALVNCPECGSKFVISDTTKEELKDGVEADCPNCKQSVQVHEKDFNQFILIPAKISQRVFSYFLDEILLFIVILGFFLLLDLFSYLPILIDEIDMSFYSILPPISPILVIFVILYYTVLDSKSQTYGKEGFDIYVVTKDGKKITKSKSFFRFILFRIFNFPPLFIISFFTMLFTKEKLALHDIMTKTRVIFYKNNK